jgi:hypothetical protein
MGRVLSAGVSLPPSAWMLSCTPDAVRPPIPPYLVLAPGLPPGTSRHISLSQVKPAHLRGY